MEIVEANPEMLDQLLAGSVTRLGRTLNGIIAWSLGLWCELILRSWTTGVVGAIAQEWSSQLELGHPPPRLKA